MYDDFVNVDTIEGWQVEPEDIVSVFDDSGANVRGKVTDVVDNTYTLDLTIDTGNDEEPVVVNISAAENVTILWSE